MVTVYLLLKGKYLPSTNDRMTAFMLQNGLRLFGGFAGTETNVKQRNISQNPTILSGDIGVQGDSTDNSYNIMRGENLDSTTLVDGLIFRHANSDGGDKFTPYVGNIVNGGGMFLSAIDNKLCRPAIKNCIFEYNASKYNGSGIFCKNEFSGLGCYVNLENCIFRYNASVGRILFFYANQPVTIPYRVKIANCRFEKIILYSLMNSNGSFGNYLGAIMVTSQLNLRFDASYSYFEGIEGVTLNTAHKCSFINLYKDKYHNAYIKAKKIDSCYFKNTNLIGDELTAEHCTFEDKSYNNSTMGVSLKNCLVRNYLGIIGEPDRSVENTVFEDCENAGISISSSVSGVKPFVLKNCVFRNNKGILLSLACGSTQSISAYIINNTFYNNVTKSNKSLFYQINGTLYFENNIFAKNSKNVFRTQSGQLNIQNCIFDHSTKNLVSWDTIIPSVGTDTLILGGQTNIEKSLFETNAQFVSESTNDFHLLPCSSAINKGSNPDGNLGITSDFEGFSRIKYDTIDIGAYEFRDYKASNYSTLPTYCTSNQGAFLPILKGNCASTPIVSWENDKKTKGQGNDKLSAGTYTFFIKDSNGCADTIKNVTIKDQGNIAPDIQINNLNNININNGSITISKINNGKSPYKYIWSTGDTTKQIINLAAGSYAVSISDANGCKYSTTVTVSAPSKVEDLLENQISIYPNPTNTKVFLKNINKIKVTKLEIFNTKGQKLEEINADSTEIDMNLYQSGLYFLKISTDDGFIFKKIIKQE